jgi:FAD:protein FMN transferase
LGLVLSLNACSPKAPRLLELKGMTMGSAYSVKYIPTEKTPSLPELQSLVDKRLVELNLVISTYEKESEISRLNQLSKEEWFTPSPVFKKALEHALSISKLTDGFYDPTVGPLVNLWGFGPGGKRTDKPSAAQINEVLEKVGYQKIEWNKERTAFKKFHEQSYFDLSSLGQGMGIDMIGQILDEFEVEHYLVNIAGELTGKGQKPEGDWMVAIEAPHQERGVVQRVLALKNMALTTSGNYRQFFEAEGKRYAHTINPLTGIPVQHTLISVSVIDTEMNSMRSDSLSTALLSLGPDLGFQFALDKGIPAYFIIENPDKKGFYIERFSPRWLELFPDSVVESN